MTQSRLLIIGAVWPEPSASAAGTRMLQLIRCFQQANYLIQFACVTESQTHAIDLSTLDINTSVIKPNDSTVDAEFKRLNPHIVIFDRFYIEEQFGWRISESCPDAIKILDTEDLHSLRQARHTIVKQSPDQLLSHTPEFAHTDLGLREIAAICRCDLSLMISEVEIALLNAQLPTLDTQLLYCPFMLTTDEMQHTPSTEWDFLDRKNIVWIGNFLHEPNWDAVRFLQRFVWPKIREQIPDIEIHIYGAYMPDKAKQLNDPKSGFFVLGRAENAFDVLQQASLMLAPIRFGAGLKGKLVEAMQCGTPSVCTEVAAEGIAGENIWPGAVCSTIDSLVEETVRLYTTQDLWNSAQNKALPLLNNRFSAATFEQKLLSAIDTLKVNLEESRKNNLIGAMMNHHHQRSTKYMSRWIETKNKLLSVGTDKSTN